MLSLITTQYLWLKTLITEIYFSGSTKKNLGSPYLHKGCMKCFNMHLILMNFLPWLKGCIRIFQCESEDNYAWVAYLSKVSRQFLTLTKTSSSAWGGSIQLVHFLEYYFMLGYILLFHACHKLINLERQVKCTLV